MITRLPDGDFECYDGYREWVENDKTVLRTVFENGTLENAEVFQAVRKRLYSEGVYKV
jgi:hypothetical protein